MPFIGQDWRSPGEAWVKTETLGWQRMKIIESQLHPNCHQSAACSWPPKNDYGQHMDNHCGHRDDNDAPKTLVTGEQSKRTGSLSSSDSDSPASSRGGSLSPSPSSSPEKNTHHIHPIAISSPYGWHLCHSDNNDCCTRNHRSSIMSKSLSKESLVSTGNNLQGTRTMRYNRSVSDFRNAPNCLPPKPRQYLESPKSDSSAQKTKAQVEEDGCVHLRPPSLIRNNQQRINGHHEGDDHDNLSVDVGRERSTSESTTGFHVSELDKQNRQIGKSQGCCCCCSGTGTSTATATGIGTGIGARTGSQSGSPCNFYPLKEPNGTRAAPHCRISVRTREVAMYNTISEAFYRLDFCNAIHDIRRFNYICKLLHLLITQNLTSLSGCATRVLFSMLEQVAWEVSNNKRNIHILKNLLKELRQMIEKYYCWGRPIGSSLLWQQHFETIERISQIVDGIELAPAKGTTTSFTDLPVEMIREVLLRLNDYRDLVSSAQASPVMQIMIDNQFIWQKLCKYHFTEQQLKFALENRCNYRPRTTSSVQGIKYARTASADGRTSYRNPVNPSSIDLPSPPAKSNRKKEGQSSSASASISRQKRNQVVDPVTTTTDEVSNVNRRQSSSTNSYVTRAIRIFDREGTSATLGTGLVRRNVNTADQPPQADRRITSNNTGQPQSDGNHSVDKQKQERSTSQRQQALNTNNLRSSSLPSRDIDWERVFHQLRK